MAKYNRFTLDQQTVKGAVAAVETGFSELESLHDDVRDVVDNAEGGRAETQRMQTLSETADGLEVEMPEAPETHLDSIDALNVVVAQSLLKGKQRGRESRSTRRDNSCNYLRAGIEAVREWCDAQEEALEAAVGQMREELENDIQSWSDWCDEVENIIDEVDALEFPGMCG